MFNIKWSIDVNLLINYRNVYKTQENARANEPQTPIRNCLMRVEQKILDDLYNDAYKDDWGCNFKCKGFKSCIEQQ